MFFMMNFTIKKLLLILFKFPSAVFVFYESSGHRYKNSNSFLTQGPAPCRQSLFLLVKRNVSCCRKDARASPRISRPRWQPPCVGATRLDNHSCPSLQLSSLRQIICWRQLALMALWLVYSCLVMFQIVSRGCFYADTARDVRYERPCCTRRIADVLSILV